MILIDGVPMITQVDHPGGVIYLGGAIRTSHLTGGRQILSRDGIDLDLGVFDECLSWVGAKVSLIEMNTGETWCEGVVNGGYTASLAPVGDAVGNILARYGCDRLDMNRTQHQFRVVIQQP